MGILHLTVPKSHWTPLRLQNQILGVINDIIWQYQSVLWKLWLENWCAQIPRRLFTPLCGFASLARGAITYATSVQAPWFTLINSSSQDFKRYSIRLNLTQALLLVSSTSNLHNSRSISKTSYSIHLEREFFVIPLRRLLLSRIQLGFGNIPLPVCTCLAVFLFW
jgi:hypothetical protein